MKFQRFQRDSMIVDSMYNERLITGFGINATNGINDVDFRRIETAATSDLHLIPWTACVAVALKINRSHNNKYCNDGSEDERTLQRTLRNVPVSLV